MLPRNLLLCLALPLTAAADAPDRLPQFEKLANGLRICAISRPAAHQIDVQTWFRVGSSYDPPTLPGLTDAVRILLQNEIDPFLNSSFQMSGRPETLRDAVVITTSPVMISEKSEADPRTSDQVISELRSIFQAHAKCFRRPRYEKEAFEKFKWFHNDDSPLVEFQLLEMMFQGHPYRFAPYSWGDRRSISDKDALAQHYDRWFAPTNATVFVSGPLDPERVMAVAKETLGPIEWRDTPQRAAFDPPPDEAVFLPTDAALDLRLTYCWLTPGRNWLDNFAIDVLFEHLLRAPDGPLRKNLNEARLLDSKWAREDWKHAGIVSLAAFIDASPESTLQSRSENARQFATIVAQELSKAAQTPLDAESLVWARNKVVQNQLLRRTTSSDRLRRMAEWELLGGDILLFDWEIPRIERITAADVMMAATALSETRRIIRGPDIPDGGNWRRIATSQPTSRPVEMGYAAWLAMDRTGLGVSLFSWPDGLAPISPPDELGANLKVQFRKCPDLEMVLIEVPADTKHSGPCGSIHQKQLESVKWNSVIEDRGILAWRVQCMHRSQRHRSWGLAARKDDFAAAFEVLLRQNKQRKNPEKWEAPLIIHGDLDWPETLRTARRVAAECQ